MDKAIVLVDPVTEWREVVTAAHAANYLVISLQVSNVTPRFAKFLPTSDQLMAAGVSHTLMMEQRDVFDSLRQLQLLSMEHRIEIVAIIPLSEIAVEVADSIAAGLKLPHNPLDLMTARRDKGMMKLAVASKGLRVAKHSRVRSVDDICVVMEKLSMTFPVVVKTPSGMSTSDVFICSSQDGASNAINRIIGKISPDGRVTNEVLLEEYIAGTEFAVNLMAFRSTTLTDSNTSCQHRLLVTDMWKYNKNDRARYESAEMCNPNDLQELVEYAMKVAEAVGVQYGAAHVELKATLRKDGTYTNPILIEVGARLSGGRKSTMARDAIENWNPFKSLILSHRGLPCPDSCGSYLVPQKFARHVFLEIRASNKFLFQ